MYKLQFLNRCLNKRQTKRLLYTEAYARHIVLVVMYYELHILYYVLAIMGYYLRLRRNYTNRNIRGFFSLGNSKHIYK